MGKLSLIIPLFNEKEAINNFLDGLETFLNRSLEASECIIVDDGSTDGTSEIFPRDCRIATVIRHPLNRGYGASIKTGLNNASGDFFCIIDADGSYALDDICKLTPFMERYDMIVGARPQTNMPLRQKIAKTAVSAVLNVACGQRVEDINSGLMLMRRDFVQKYAFMLSDKFSFTASITLVMLLAKRRIKYVPISYLPRQEHSKVQLCSYIINFLKGYFRIIRYHAKSGIT